MQFGPRFILAAGLSLCAASAFAQQAAAGYPNKPVRVIVPVASGGGTDIIARIVMTKLGEQLGGAFVIDNRAGAGGILGNEIVAHAQPDGYTLLFTYAAHTIVPFIYRKVPYDVYKDFAPVTMAGSQPLLLEINAGVKANTVQELIALYKREPGKYNFATGGNGTHAHLICEWLMQRTGTSIVHVPFRGGGPALQAVLAGEPSMIIDNLPTALPHILAGRVKALAIFSAKRAAVLPDVPTMVEAGYKDMVTDSWTAFYAPAGTPPDVIAKLNAAAVAAVRDPATMVKLTQLSAVPVGSTP